MRVPPPGTPEIRSLLSLAIGAVVVAALYVGSEVLIPLTLAVLLSFVLTPVVNALGRMGLPRAPSVLLAVLMAFGVVALAATLIASQASQFTADAPRYAAAIDQKLRGLQQFATARISGLTRTFELRERGRPPTAVTQPPAVASATTSTLSPGTQPQPVLVEIAKPDTSLLPVARTILAPILGPLETTVIVLVVAIFILMQREDLRDRLIRLAGSNDLQRTTLAMNDAAARLSRYFVSQLAVNATFGTVIGIGLWAIGIPSPALWAVIAGLLRFVPYVGPVLAVAPPLAVGAAIDPGWRTAIEVALLFIVVEPLTGYFIEPLLYGHSTGLAPVSVIVAAVFWTWIWGPIGLILSTPLTLCAVVMGRHVKSLEFLDVLLGDRPALTPVDAFYQRIVANNPDDALENAEAFLAGHSLLEYYDTVALHALERAARDEARGLISRERAAEMSRSMIQVFEDLNEYQDRDREVSEAKRASTRQPSSTGRIICAAGRGPFDDAVSAMLAQLLAHRGMRSARVPHAAVTRDRIAAFDPTGVAAVVLSYLDMTGSSSHLKYLVRRLRQHAPDVKIIVGLWPADPIGAEERARLEAIGADLYVSSLREAMDASMTAARTLSSAADHSSKRG